MGLARGDNGASDRERLRLGFAQFLREHGRSRRAKQPAEMICGAVKQRAILGHDPLKFVEHLADFLEIGQFPAGDHDEAAAGSAEAIEGGCRRVVERAVVGQGAIIIARED